MVLTIIVALFCGSITLATLAFTFHSFNRGYEEGIRDSAVQDIVNYENGFNDGTGKVGKILADNADLDEIMVIRLDDGLPHRYKRIID